MRPSGGSARTVDVEQVVREVMARLDPTGSVVKQVTRSTERELKLTGQVISLAELKGKVEAIDRLILPTGAVITPAARDYLREYDVSATFSAARGGTSRREASLVVAAAETSFDPARIVSVMSGRGAPVEVAASHDLPDAIETLSVEIIEGGKRTLLFTDHSAVAVCLANRRRGVRACTGLGWDDVRRSAESIGANMLVSEPRGSSSFELRRMIEAFLNLGDMQCPAKYAAALQ